MRLLLIICFFILSFVSRAEESIWKDRIYDPKIKTVKCTQSGLDATLAITALNGGVPIDIDFDDLSTDTRALRYAIIPCNWDWTSATLNAYDCIDGFAENSINNYQRSFNTETPYTHYTISFPNEQCKFKKSGNYIIQIKDFDNGNVLLTKRLLVIDAQAAIVANCIRPRNNSLLRTHQEIDFTVNAGGINMANPMEDIKVVILQNQIWANAITNIQPMYFNDNVLKYNCDMDAVFPAGKEFRRVDIRTIRFAGMGVQRNDNTTTPPNVYIQSDPCRANVNYVYNKDYNGEFYIEKQETNNPNTEADYVLAHFHYASPLLNEAQLFWCGQASQYEFSKDYEFKYNPSTKGYDLDLFLKNGYYEYLIGTAGGDSRFDFATAEGNWYETENEYTILVYYRSFSGRYDQLVGVNNFHSMR